MRLLGPTKGLQYLFVILHELLYDELLTFKLIIHFVERWQQIKLSFVRRHDANEELFSQLY